jgi:integrase/recombinase XerD
MKEYVLTKIRDTLYGKIPNEEISTVIDSVSFCLRNYDIMAKETSVVVYDNSDSQIISKFFIAKAVEGLCQSSLDYYRVILRAFILHVGKHIKEIVTDDVRVYLAYKKINKCSDNTLNNIRRTLSSFFTWCTEEGVLDRNPMLRIKGVRQVKKLKKPLSEDDMERLRSLARTKRNKAIIEFLFSTGCRVSEMVNVNLGDVDWQNGQIDVLGKGRKYRTVYLSARCKIALQEYVDSRTDDLEANKIAKS